MKARISAISITVILYLIVMLYGISFTMVGPLMPDLLKQYGLTMAEGGTIFSIQSISGLISVILCGLFGDRLNKKLFIALGVGLFLISLFGVGTAPSFGLLMVAFFLLGLGSRGFDTLVNALISDLHSDRRSLFLNLLHTFFGIGAFLGPLYVFSLTGTGKTWDVTFKYLGLIVAVLFAAYLLFLLFDRKATVPSRVEHEKQDIGLTSLFIVPRMWVLGIIILIHMGVLGTLTAWLPSFSVWSTGAGDFMSSFILSALWVGIILSRGLVSRLSDRFGEIFMIRWGSLISLLIFTPAVLVGEAVYLAIAALGMGLFVGFTIPYLMSVGYRWYPDKSAAVTSMIFIFGYVSIAAYPWFTGMLSDSYGLLSAMLVVVASQAVLFGTTWLLPGRNS